MNPSLRSLLLVVFLLLPGYARAWNATGHEIVAAIAWDQMTPAARQESIRLLRAAPREARLLELLPDDRRSLAVRERELFINASTWPDLVRGGDRAGRFHHGTWHYINLFWEQQTPRSRPQIRPGSAGDLVNKLKEFDRTLRSPRVSDSEKGIQLAWVLHLIGDIHQPLHCSARITAEEPLPTGDKGGNAFCVRRSQAGNCTKNLHSYWDGIFDVVFRDRSTDQIAREVAQRHAPRRAALRLHQYQQWADVGRRTAMRVAYPASLERDEKPSEQYEGVVSAAAQPAAALGGARLAATLNQIFAR